MTSGPGLRLGAGDVVLLSRAASPQFVVPISVRVIREIPDRHPPHGWTWIEGYQLNSRGLATAKRELFVLVEGVRLADRLLQPHTGERGRSRSWTVSVPHDQKVSKI